MPWFFSVRMLLLLKASRFHTLAFPWCRVRAWLTALVLFVTLSGSAIAQRPKELVAKPGRADIDTKVTQPKLIYVVDEENQPLAEAEVRVGWWEDAEGDSLLRLIRNPPKTNDEGNVLIEVPRGAVRAQISAVAPGFASAGKQYSLSGQPKIILKRGQVVRVRAVDAEGNPITEAVPLLQNSRRWPHEFTAVPGDPGLFVSPVVDLERRWLRVSDANGQGPLRFSELIDVRNPEHIDEEGNIEAVLTPGIRLEGKLDDSVPRPVKGGCVELYIKEGAGHRIEPHGWTWEDMAEVHEDGTFVFPSLPRGGHVQLMAVVEGYQSVRPSQQYFMNYLFEHDAADPEILTAMFDRYDSFWPHLFPLPEDQERIDITLPGTPTASVDVKIIDPLGEPLPGATVRFNPNGYFVGGNLCIPGSGGFKDAARVRKDNDHYKRIRDWAQDAFMRVETNQQGIAQVRSLPSDGRDSYRVEADGYVLPIHPTSSAERESRYVSVDLVGGETQQQTVTMERFIPRETRKLTVVDDQGKPLEGITAIVTELALQETNEDWHLWSTARFGAVASGTSSSDGTLELKAPVEVEGKEVARLRIFLKGKVGDDASVYGERLIIPTRPDGNVLMLTVSQEKPKEHAYRDVRARYVSAEEVLQLPPKTLLQRLEESPSILLLSRLLEESEFDEATPLKLRGSSNILQSRDAPPVVRLETKDGPRVVALCYVRPKDAPWKDSPKLSSPPEAGFVFDGNDASLVGMVGGWTSSKGSHCRLMLTDLGTPGDYFFKAMASEENGNFGYFEQWTLVRQPESPALTFYCLKRGPAWSADYSDDKTSPPAEFGHLEFRPQSARSQKHGAGWLKNGAFVPRKIYWDGQRNKFLGLPELWYESTPLYEVDLERSALFDPLPVPSGNLVAGGARRGYKNWHAWDVTIPRGGQGEVALLLIEKAEDQPSRESVVKQVHHAQLSAGLHYLQLQIRDSEEDAESSNVKLKTGQDDLQTFSLPRIPISNERSIPDGTVLRTDPKSIDLLRVPTDKPGVWLTWRLSLEQ